MAHCEHFGCRFDCPLAPWNFDKRFLERAPRFDHRLSYLRRYIMWLKDIYSPYFSQDPLFIYSQSRVGLGWLDPAFGTYPVL